MLSIYTYPINSATGYIDPDYYGETTPAGETGYYRRILELKNGTYKTWATGQTPPVDTVSDLITATGEFHRAISEENGGENIQIYSYYNQPLITIDSVLISQDITTTDTDASPAARLTVNDTSDFVDGNAIFLSGFDGTLSDLNGFTRYADVIDSTTIDLYVDSALTSPVQYFTQITNQQVSAIDYDNANPLTDPITVTLTGLTSSVNNANITFNNNAGFEQARLNALGQLFVNDSPTPGANKFNLYQTNLIDKLTIDEYMNNDYLTFGRQAGPIPIDELVDANDEYIISTTTTASSQSIFKIQKIGPGGWPSYTGLQNLPGESTYTINSNASLETRVYAYGDDPAVDPALTANHTSNIKLFRKTLVKKNGTNDYWQSPGKGNYIIPVYDDTGVTQINVRDKAIVSRDNDTTDNLLDTNFYYAPHDRYYYYGEQLGYTTPTTGWNDFTRTTLEKTINGTTYDVVTTDANLNGSSEEDGNMHDTWPTGSNVDEIFSANLTTSGNNADGTPVSNVPRGFNTVFLGRRAGATSTPSKLFDIVEAIWNNSGNAGYQAPYIEFYNTSTGYRNKLAVLPVRTYSFHGPYADPLQNTVWFHGYEVTLVDARSWEQGVALDDYSTSGGLWTPPADYYTLQSATISLGGCDVSTAGDDTFMQTRNNIWQTPDYTVAQSPFTTDLSWNTGYLPVLGVGTSGSKYLTISSTSSLFNIIQTGTKLYAADPTTTPSTAFYYVKLVEGPGYNTGTYKMFTLHSGSDWSNHLVFPSPTWWTQGDNYFSEDTSKDYTHFVDPSTNMHNSLNRFNETNEVRFLEMNDHTGQNGTATLGTGAIVDSTTGNVSLSSTHNYKAANPKIYFPGNQTYQQRTGESTYVNGAFITDMYYPANSYNEYNFTTGEGIKPGLTISQSAEGYIDGITLTNPGRLTGSTRKMLLIGTTPDTYIPPTPTSSAAEDIWDTDDEWASDGDTTPEKVWPHHITPMSAVINYNSPTLVNNSQSGIKYTRSVGHTKWRLEVEYPPMSAEDFQKFHAVAQAAHGQSTPFLFKLQNKDGTSILWKDFYDQSNSTTTPRIKNDITPGDTTILVEGFNSNETDAFKRGEVFIDGENENGNLHTSLSGTDSNVYGEAKIRTPWPFRTAQVAGTQIHKNPEHAIVTFASDNFEYQVDVNNYYFVSVAFDLDSWK